ncbi:MAG: hypothetical protein KatS3mg105_3981 [Gemmatales bacterium]|nr:MAG: hypothetical protein KatS3mg105_3981 [Gemmatales bacterium]
MALVAEPIQSHRCSRGEMSRNSRVIVLIDDDRQWAKAALELLREQGYEVQWAADGAEGLALLEETTPFLVILDVQLPRIGGIEVLRQLRSQSRQIPVLMVSGEDRAGIVSQAQAEGANSFLRKPISGDILLHAVERLTRNVSISSDEVES